MMPVYRIKPKLVSYLQYYNERLEDVLSLPDHNLTLYQPAQNQLSDHSRC
jgi:hypothetical protein